MLLRVRPHINHVFMPYKWVICASLGIPESEISGEIPLKLFKI